MRYNINSGISVERNTSVLATVAALASAGIIAIATLIQPASAATSTVVTPTNLQGWTEYGGGADLEFVVDDTAPAGSGALQMSASEDSQYSMFWRDTSGTQVKATDLNVSYATKRVDGPVHAAPAYVLLVDKDGDPETQDGFYAIYEPVYNDNGSEDYDVWNTWDITAESKFWYNNAYADKPVGAVNYTSLNSVLGEYPNATISAVTLNIGTGNAGWDVLVDSVVTTDGEYNFELVTLDSSAPDVTITTPQDGSNVSGSVDLVGTVTDENPMNSFFRITGPNGYNQTSLYTDGRPTHEYKWNTVLVSDGEYTIKFEARDQAGNKDTGSVTTIRVTVDNVAGTKEECKNGRFATYGFKNQGQCVSSVVSNKNN